MVAPIPALDGVTVGIRRLDLADYLASPAIVVRRGGHEVLTSDFHRWGEDPADGINRAVARQLTAAASFRAVGVAPWPVRTPHDFLIQLHITRFAGVVPTESSAMAGATAGSVAGAAHVRASWEIIRQRDETVLARGDTEHVEEGWTVGDYATLVALVRAIRVRDGGRSRGGARRGSSTCVNSGGRTVAVGVVRYGRRRPRGYRAPGTRGKVQITQIAWMTPGM